ncbi:barstar family protein [Knoellia sp. S7-12]|uniref:barstar family protein n=1 Tax=Knoellia sp. S7-12 TaxID=3126698 RepID=UPI003367C7BF
MRVLNDRVDLDGLIADAVEEGRQVQVVRGAATKQATLEAFSQELNFPEWFGMNLDALADCLDTLARESDGNWEIVWDDAAALRRLDPGAATGIESVLADLDETHATVHVTIIDR